MDPLILLIILAIVSVVAVYKLTARKPQPNDDAVANASTAAAVAPRGDTGAARRAPVGSEGNSDDDDDDDGEDEEDWSHLPRLQRLKKQKEKERRRRRAEQEAADAARREREMSRAERAEMREAQEAEREAKEEEALRELREAKRREDDEEYAKWVGEIGVEERGELGDEARLKHERVVDYLITRANEVAQGRTRDENGSGEGENASACVMVLQDGARVTGVTVPELVATIEQLLKDERITGVFDDRGKFVFASEEHLRQVAKFIKLRGRVSVVELARECNKIIMHS